MTMTMTMDITMTMTTIHGVGPSQTDRTISRSWIPEVPKMTILAKTTTMAEVCAGLQEPSSWDSKCM